ncbi:MAG: hypothetical protein FJ123_13395, partial [Deltaproteobacteria bacterium]|nr:hypothetical protein [Deltaproteobacteria bacterium]
MRSTTMQVFLTSALFFIMSFCQAAHSQDNPLNKYAQETVDKYLKGMSIFELSEGKQMVAATSWPQWGNKPVLLKYETVFEGMFNTDISTIKGYKRLVDAWVKSEAGTPLPRRVLLIAYPGARDKEWRVLVYSF